jgi:hypothetical protein
MNHPTVTRESTPGAEALRVDDALLERVLRPYRAKGCVYLTSLHSTAGDDGVVRGFGELEIGESCYIDDTGHLNAAEVVICFNQLLYTLLAVSVRDHLLPVFDGWTADDYWRRQLDGVLITRFTSTFSRPISPRRFRGEIGFVRAMRDGALIWLETTFAFGDDAGGTCSGGVRVAVTAL